MPFITVGKEKTLEAVATRMLTARASKSAHAEAVAALAAANPGVEMKPGTVLVVPPLREGRVRVDGAHEGPVADLLARVDAAMDELSDAITAQAEADAAERQRTARLIASADLKQAAAKDATLRAQLSEIARAVKAETKAASGEPERWQGAIAQWRTQLGTLPLDATQSPSATG